MKTGKTIDRVLDVLIVFFAIAVVVTMLGAEYIRTCRMSEIRQQLADDAKEIKQIISDIEAIPRLVR